MELHKIITPNYKILRLFLGWDKVTGGWIMKGAKYSLAACIKVLHIPGGSKKKGAKYSLAAHIKVPHIPGTLSPKWASCHNRSRPRVLKMRHNS